MQNADNLQRMIAVTAFVAVRLLQIREHIETSVEGDGCSCDVVFERDEWHVLWKAKERKPLPAQPPSLSWAYYAIATLGGFTDAK